MSNQIQILIAFGFLLLIGLVIMVIFYHFILRNGKLTTIFGGWTISDLYGSFWISMDATEAKRGTVDVL
jgi:hypothetical protein